MIFLRAQKGKCGETWDQKWIEFGKDQNSGFFALQFSGWEEGEEMITLVKVPFILQNNNNNNKSPFKKEQLSCCKFNKS